MYLNSLFCHFLHICHLEFVWRPLQFKNRSGRTFSSVTMETYYVTTSKTYTTSWYIILFLTNVKIIIFGTYNNIKFNHEQIPSVSTKSTTENEHLKKFFAKKNRTLMLGLMRAWLKASLTISLTFFRFYFSNIS